MKNLLLACAYVSTIALDCAAQSPPLAVMGETYVVENTVLNMRSGPGTQHGVIGKLAPGNTVELVRGEGTWWLVEGRGVQGYVAAQHLRRTDLAGWVPKDYRTGATPECENVTPRYDRSMDNFLRVKVGSNTDVVVKLMKAGSYGGRVHSDRICEGRRYLRKWRTCPKDGTTLKDRLRQGLPTTLRGRAMQGALREERLVRKRD
ncbi:MAG: SH3 domain-containing protein [Flavobacteriales bacterium]|nr:SH3 domain-containing protein [Flavobacteriales bacterium]